MRANHQSRRGDLRLAGVALMESVLALALIAFVMPVVMLVLSQVGASAQSVSMEHEARRAIQSHVSEVMHDDGFGRDDRMVWAHDAAGHCIGRLEPEVYDLGLRSHEGAVARYLIVAEVGEWREDGLRSLSLRLEHPAAAPMLERSRIEVFSQIVP